MRLLILTQKVNINDPVLGFFHRWVEEFAKHCDQVTVIALGVGEYHLPDNVRVFSLGKEQLQKRSDLENSVLRPILGEQLRKLKYVFNFYRLIWRERKNYDAVFVHMNPEYVILGGLIWRLMRKHTSLWYTHKSVDLKLRIALLITHDIFTASKESFRLPSKKVHIVGHGIDTDFFTPDVSVMRGDHMLSVGRLMPSKRHDLVIRVATFADRTLRIAGDGPEWKNLEQFARSLGAKVQFLGGLTQAQLRDEYRRATRFVHRSETGSLDKVVLEAAACGCPIDTADLALAGLPFSPSYVRKNHGLSALIPRILSSYETTN